jgi:hypothetical protein
MLRYLRNMLESHFAAEGGPRLPLGDKIYGDSRSVPADFDEQVKALVRHGYTPYNAASRITGLPTDEAARLARGAEQYPLGMLHGSTPGITEFNDKFLSQAAGGRSADRGHFGVAVPGLAAELGAPALTGRAAQIRELASHPSAAEEVAGYYAENAAMAKAQGQPWSHIDDDDIDAQMEAAMDYASRNSRVYRLQVDPGQIGHLDFGKKNWQDAGLHDDIAHLQDSGADTVILRSIEDPAPATNHVVVKDPRRVRSESAYFDPAFRGKVADWSAGVGGLSLLGASLPREASAMDQLPHPADVAAGGDTPFWRDPAKWAEAAGRVKGQVSDLAEGTVNVARHLPELGSAAWDYVSEHPGHAAAKTAEFLGDMAADPRNLLMLSNAVGPQAAGMMLYPSELGAADSPVDISRYEPALPQGNSHELRWEMPPAPAGRLVAGGYAAPRMADGGLVALRTPDFYNGTQR